MHDTPEVADDSAAAYANSTNTECVLVVGAGEQACG